MNNDYSSFLKSIKMVVISVLTIAAIFLAVISISYIRTWTTPIDNPSAAKVTVAGEGEMFVVPDIATFSFTVLEEGKTVKEAQDKATTKTNATISFLKTSGIEDKDIKTTAYNANPKYEYQQASCTSLRCPPGKQVLIGYEVSQTIQVKVRKTDQAGTILSGIGGLNVSYVSGLEFTVDDQNAIIEQAREKAIADAKEKAKILARDLGVRLVRITGFVEGNQGMPIPYYGKLESTAARDAASSIAPSLPGGENKYVSNVTLTYEVR